MDTMGLHLLVEFWGCSRGTLDNPAYLEKELKRAAEKANTTIIGVCLHQFSPEGVSGVVVIQESHLSIHTWPEHGYAAVDFYTCGQGEPAQAYYVLREALSSQRAEIITVRRGLGQNIPCEVTQDTWSFDRHAYANSLPSGAGAGASTPGPGSL